MKIRSARFRDQPEKPLDRAVWWVEYILRNPNPDHLKSPVLKLGFVAANLYDIILCAFILIVVVVVAIWNLVLCILRNVSKKSDLAKKTN